MRFFTVPYCTIFEVTMHATVLSNASRTLEYNDTIVTQNDPEHEFKLSEFNLDIQPSNDEEDVGTAIISWKHEYQCVEKYVLRLKKPDSGKGEDVIDVSVDDVGQNVSHDIGMVPGVLTMENCQMYHLSIYPDSFPSLKENPSTWDEGYSMSFPYQTETNDVPNKKDTGGLSLINQLGTTQMSLNLGKIASFYTCTEVQATLNTKRSIVDDRNEARDLGTHDPVDGLAVNDLLPCTNYQILFNKDDELIHEEKFRTKQEPDSVLPLDESEFIETLKMDDGKDNLNLTWADRCLDKYELVYCKMPMECSNDDSKIELNVEKQDGNLVGTVIYNLSPCSLYKYELRGRETVLKEGNVSTSVGNFDFELPNFEIIQNASHFVLVWQHTFDCIKSYQIQVTGGSLDLKFQVEAPDLLTTMDDSRVIVNLKDEAASENQYLEECSVYEIEISNDASDSTFTKSIQYFVTSVPPQGFKSTDRDQHHVDLEWEHKQCYQEYLLQIENETSSWNVTISGQEAMEAYKITDLKPCTKYGLKLRSVSDEKGISEDYTPLTVYTEHPEEVEIESVADYERIFLNVMLHGTDCVTSYKMFVFNDDGEHQEQEVSESGNYTFAGLNDGSFFTYQLIGYDEEKQAAFTSPEIGIKTKLIVTVNASVYEVKNTSAKVDFRSSIFEDLKEEDLKFETEMDCRSKDSSSKASTSTKHQSLIFDDLTPNTDYECEGFMTFEGKQFKLPTQVFKTANGVPGPPDSITVSDYTHNKLDLKWEPPKITNGEIIDYKVILDPQCRATIDSDGKSFAGNCAQHCSQKMTLHTNSTHLVVEDLEPVTSYSISISAKTHHESYGKSHDKTLEFMTRAAPPERPVITKAEATSGGNIVVDFEHKCPLTGPTTFEARWMCNQVKNKNGFCANSTSVKQYLHGTNSKEIVGLNGGYYYDIWIEASVKKCSGKSCVSESEKKVVYIDCEHRCLDGTCLNRRWNVKCDYIKDCPDGSDEFDCSCDPPNHFECGNGYCIDAWKKCDGVADCNDRSDETVCPSCTGKNEFRCKVTGECITMAQTCDRKIDCRDGSDEYGCPYWKTR